MVEYKMNHMVVIRLRGVDADLAFADILDHLVRLSPRYVKKLLHQIVWSLRARATSCKHNSNILPCEVTDIMLANKRLFIKPADTYVVTGM